MLVNLEDAYLLLSRSQPVVIPTETVFGLAARMDDEAGVRAIFRLKGRPAANPLIIHIHDGSLLDTYVSFMPESALLLKDRFWPGGLTLCLPVKEHLIPSSVRAGLPTAAFRMPAHATTLSLLERTGPLVAPSANLSGKPSATTIAHIEEDFGKDFPILFSEELPCSSGIESTILIWKDDVWWLGRPGAISLEEIAPLLGYEPLPVIGKTPLCPGQLFRHYAPKAQLFLGSSPWNADEGRRFDAVLGFADRRYDNAKSVIPLGLSTDFLSVTNRLYAALRELDEYLFTTVFVDMDFPATWTPIRDRLTKAAKGE